ncbi:hypothetical protein AB0M46_33040 [Dactylosporangium sp. NPDC051485]|uniref:hypothetical protein n=1 Tax=Dactylosporangium sp. NPDC051485 TaxID=3154846 RepID=UPI0034227A7B
MKTAKKPIGAQKSFSLKTDRSGGRPPVITDDMLHTILRGKALGESVEQIQPDLIIPTGKRKGQSPSVASIYRALAEHEKARAYPEAIEAAHEGGLPKGLTFTWTNESVEMIMRPGHVTA